MNGKPHGFFVAPPSAANPGYAFVQQDESAWTLETESIWGEQSSRVHEMTSIYETDNNDNGSLFTGSQRPSIGDSIHIDGEPRPWIVTYVMGSDAKGWRACFKGQGAVPEGRVRWTTAPQGTRAKVLGPSLAASRPQPMQPSPASSRPATGWPAPLMLPTRRRPSFDAYLMVGWSSSATRKRGPDSIWWVASRWRDGHLHFAEAMNPDTRSLAKDQLTKLHHCFVDEGLNVLVGFDFPYGYPAGFANLLGKGATPPWRTTWDHIAERITDHQSARGTNNRLEVAAQINRAIGGRGPFWGHPPIAQYPGLTSTEPPLPCGTGVPHS